MDGDRAGARGGRRLLVDRAERDRARPRAVYARRRRGRRRRRARVRPPARGVPLRAARRASPPRLGACDRAALAVRAGRRDPPRGAEGRCRPDGRGPRGEDRPRGGVPPDARGALARAAARRAAVSGGGRRALAVCARAPARGAAQRPGGPRGSRGRRRGRARRAYRRARGAVGGDDDRAPIGAGGSALVISEAQVWDALAEIADPEIPVISLVDLGVIRSVDVSSGHVRVEFTPTFLACPALEAMRSAMEDKVAELGARAEVQVVQDDSWSTDKITPAGREKLRAAGFAPPTPREATAPRLVQLQTSVFRCPYCGSTKTRLENIFGPTPCRSLRYCESCRQPFEQFKTI